MLNWKWKILSQIKIFNNKSKSKLKMKNWNRKIPSKINLKFLQINKSKLKMKKKNSFTNLNFYK